MDRAVGSFLEFSVANRQDQLPCAAREMRYNECVGH